MTEKKIIETIREEGAKLPLSEIVSKSNVNSSTVWRFFNGKNSVSLANAISIANACGIYLTTSKIKTNGKASEIQEKN